MSNVKQIAEGFFNNITNRNKELYKERMKICMACPLYKVDSVFGAICNPGLYINTKDETSKEAKAGFVKGCGCVLGSKTRVDEAECVIKKWKKVV